MKMVNQSVHLPWRCKLRFGAAENQVGITHQVDGQTTTCDLWGNLGHFRCDIGDFQHKWGWARLQNSSLIAVGSGNSDVNPSEIEAVFGIFCDLIDIEMPCVFYFGIFYDNYY